MAKTEIVDLTSFCSGFPEKVEQEILRDNLLDTIDRIFDANTQVIFVEGVEGIGKTTLLAQYSRRHSDITVSLFINPTCRLAYSIEYLTPILSDQIEWLLNKKTLNSSDLDISVLRSQLISLQKRIHKSGQSVKFVIDGLSEIPDEDNRITQLILKDILPIGMPGFAFLLSGDINHFLPYMHRNLRCKPYPMTTLSIGDAEEYLKGVKIETSQIREINRLCDGVPGHLAIVKRLLIAGTNIQNIIKECPAELTDFLSIELNKITDFNRDKKQLLAVIAFGRTVYNIDALSNILSWPKEKISDLLKQLQIITVNPDSGEIRFVTEAHRAYAANQLRELKEESYDLLIKELLANVNTQEALTYLPEYYEQAGRIPELLDYLTPEYYERILEHSQSLSQVARRSDLGLVAAKNSNRKDVLMRFSLQKSAITELDDAEIWRSEIEALMSLGDYDTAMALAQSVRLKEDRLHMLAVIAKGKKEKGAVEPELIEQIKLLYDQIDVRSLGERSIDIAIDLICIDTDLAIKMVEEATAAGEKKDSTDWAFATLSVAALHDSGRNQEVYADALKKTRERIKDPKVQSFYDATAFLFGKYSPDAVIDYVDNVDPKNRLYLLRQWSLANKDSSEAGKVIDYSFDLILKDNSYTPKTRDFREIATPLPSLIDKEKAIKIIGRFDSHKASLEKLGGSVDYARLQLLLAHTESKINFPASFNRMIELYWQVSNVVDVGARAECLAWILSYLHAIDPRKELEIKEGLHSVIKEDLQKAIEKLLNTTADHLYVTRNIIKALAQVKPDFALKIASSLNVSDRRDAAYKTLIAEIGKDIKVTDVSFIQKVISLIDNPYTRDEVLVSVLHSFAKLDKHTSKETVKEIAPLLEMIPKVLDAEGKCEGSCYALNIVNQEPVSTYIDLANKIRIELDQAWESIDVGWRRVDAGFKIAKTLSLSNADTARGYLKKTNDLLEVVNIDAGLSAETYLSCVRLSIRSYAGLVASGINSTNDFEGLKIIVERIPSNGERACLWSDLAIRCHSYKKNELCEKIVTEHVKPLLNLIPKKDIGYKYQVLIQSAPALYFAHQQTAIEMLAILPVRLRDLAYDKICASIFRKLPPSEPYSPDDDGFEIKYTEVVDICNILNLTTTDVILFGNIASVVNSLLSKKNRSNISKEQVNDIAYRLKQIIDKNLPDKINITHDGYKIVATAQVYRVTQPGINEWNKLITLTNRIDNKADTALILSIVATSMPDKLSSRRQEIIDMAMALIKDIPSDLDRINRYAGLGESLFRIDQNLAKKCIKSGFQESLTAETSNAVERTQTELIDIAHKIDPDFAAALVSLVDNDPARLKTQMDVKDELKLLDVKSKMLSDSTSIMSKEFKKQLPNASWMNLGSLNADKAETVHFDNVKQYIEKAAEYPLREAYPILAWAIENNIRRYMKSDQASDYAYPMFASTALTTELVASIIRHTSYHLKRVKTHVAKYSDSTISSLINVRQREQAMQILEKWLSENLDQYLKICDPYFGVEDLEIVRLVQSIRSNCKIYILTSRKHQKGVKQPWDEEYRNHWRSVISDQPPVSTELTIVGTETSGDLPIHDRWWITDKGGLKIGTSINSLGLTKLSEISPLSSEEAISREKEIDLYLKREKQQHEKDRLIYTLFSL